MPGLRKPEKINDYNGADDGRPVREMKNGRIW